MGPRESSAKEIVPKEAKSNTNPKCEKPQPERSPRYIDIHRVRNVSNKKTWVKKLVELILIEVNIIDTAIINNIDEPAHGPEPHRQPKHRRTRKNLNEDGGHKAPGRDERFGVV